MLSFMTIDLIGFSLLFFNLFNSAHEVTLEGRDNLPSTQRLREAFSWILAPLL